MLTVVPGFPTLDGAHFAVNVSMNAKAGQLLPSGASSVPALFIGAGSDTFDLLCTITTKQGVALLNFTQVCLRAGARALYQLWCGGCQVPPHSRTLPGSQDWSFIQTPIINVQTNMSAIPRRATANPRMPAYLDGVLVWGLLPSALEQPTMPAPASEQQALPDGIACESGGSGAQQACGLAVQYCCAGSEEILPYIPDQWPTPAAGPGFAPSTETAPAAEQLAAGSGPARVPAWLQHAFRALRQ